MIHYFSGGHVITFANRAVILRNSNDPKNKEAQSLTTKASSTKETRQETRRTPIPADASGRSDQEQPDEPEEERRREP